MVNTGRRETTHAGDMGEKKGPYSIFFFLTNSPLERNCLIRA
jgi:hypothetical protein